MSVQEGARVPAQIDDRRPALGYGPCITPLTAPDVLARHDPVSAMQQPQVSAPSPSPASAPANPHFTAVGGAPAIAELVERFYFYMDTRPEAAGIRAMHPADLGPVKRVLVQYLTEWTGGPAVYSPQHGHPRLRQRHLAFSIGPSERDAWMACMRAALDEVVPDAALRQQLAQAFQKTADFIRNGAGTAHPSHGGGHGGRAR